ncbi:MAG: RraA family protein [Thermomicrobiales bacterium]
MMTDHVLARSSLEHQEAKLFDQLAEELYTAVISDILDGLGFREQAMTADIRPVFGNARLIGRSHTVLSSDVYHTPVQPYEMEIQAIDSVPANYVVVASTNKSTRTCLWGELLSTATRARGGRGAVLDGHTRDVAKIESMAFPVFATGMRPVDSMGRGRIISCGEPIVCGGVLVHEGDVVFADFDGVVVIPREVEDQAISLAREKATGESAMREWLLDGKTLREAFDHFGFL